MTGVIASGSKLDRTDSGNPPGFARGSSGPEPGEESGRVVRTAKEGDQHLRLATFASRVTFPAASSTHRLLSSNDTSIPTWCSTAVLLVAGPEPFGSVRSRHHSEETRTSRQSRCRPITASTHLKKRRTHLTLPTVVRLNVRGRATGLPVQRVQVLSSIHARRRVNHVFPSLGSAPL